jgi:hypothetical protein
MELHFTSPNNWLGELAPDRFEQHQADWAAWSDHVVGAVTNNLRASDPDGRPRGADTRPECRTG